MNALEVVCSDLDYICGALSDEFSVLEGKDVLITGGAGFLGYYLVQALVHRNKQLSQTNRIKVHILDNFIRGIPPWLDVIKQMEDVSVLSHDIANLVLDEHQIFHVIIHAASIASPLFYRQHPIKTMDTNVNGLRRILDYACLREQTSEPVESILYFSSSEIYGDPRPENIPTVEDYFGHVSSTGPRACYDESKRYGETLSVNFNRQHQVKVKIVRPFNNYGPGLKISDRRLIPDIANNIFSDMDVSLLSNGGPTRTFCYVADAVIGYFKVLIRGISGEAYNIGTHTPEINVKNLAEMMVQQARELFNYQGKIKFEASCDPQYLTHNPQRRCPSIEKAKQELGFNPQISLEEGLKKTLIWYKDNRYASEC